MRQFLTMVARIIAAICVFLFVVTTVLAILITTLNGQIFNASLYKNALVEQNIYARLPEIIGAVISSSFSKDVCSQNQLACSIDGASPELHTCLTTALGAEAYQAIGSGSRSPTLPEIQLTQPCLDRYGLGQSTNIQGGTSAGGMPSFMGNITTADWQALLTSFLPPATLKAMTESTLDQVFAYLNGEAKSIYIPLDAVKQSLLSPSGAAVFLQVLNTQQPCNEQDLSQFLTGTSIGGLVFCRPPEVILPLVKVVLPELLKAVVPQIPDKVFIILPHAAGTPVPGSGTFGTDPIFTLRTVRLFMRFSLLIPLTFLLLVTLFAVRSIKSWMQWWGIPFLAAGIISVGLGVAIVPAFNTTWTWFIASRIPIFIPAILPEVGQELFRSILTTLSEFG